MLAAYYDPLFVNAEIWIREALIAILCGAILAVAVRRSQGMIFRALQAERSRANLARYFSPSMVDQLAEQDQPFEAAREQEIGVLFADMVGFTRIAENSSPEELIRLLREFHRRVAQAVFAHGGTLDKFIGDCVMATFGTPNAGADDATRTLACCRAIAATVENWNAERRAAGAAPVRIGIGAHYGPVVLGDIGDERRLEFAVLGDTVNVASRLEALTRQLACTILASDDLVRAARAESDTVEELLRRVRPHRAAETPQPRRTRRAVGLARESRLRRMDRLEPLRAAASEGPVRARTGRRKSARLCLPADLVSGRGRKPGRARHAYPSLQRGRRAALDRRIRSRHSPLQSAAGHAVADADRLQLVGLLYRPARRLRMGRRRRRQR